MSSDTTTERRSADPLAVTAVVLGALGTAMALSVVWFFLALPFGIAAAVCATVDRVRTKRRTGVPAGGLTTVGLVLGIVCVPLSVGAMLIIPQAGKLAEKSAATVQGDVRSDLDSVEKTTTDNVDQVDSTLRELVAANDASIATDFARLERETKESLAQADTRQREMIGVFDRSAGSDLARLEASARSDVKAVDGRLSSTEIVLRQEIAVLRQELDENRQQLADIRQELAANP